MTTPHDPHHDARHEELLAAAATGDLTPAEEQELEALLAADPALREELASLRGVVGHLDALGSWEDPLPSRAVEAHVDALQPRPAASRRWALAAAAVVLVGLGSASTVGVQAWQDRTPTGPPGTLGALETVAVSAEGGGPLGSARVEAALVAHTWGTEAVLDVDGAPEGEEFAVSFVDEDGRAVPAGAFLGSAVEIHCRLNAAVLREDVQQLRITDRAGEVLAVADLPDAG